MNHVDLTITSAKSHPLEWQHRIGATAKYFSPRPYRWHFISAFCWLLGRSMKRCSLVLWDIVSANQPRSYQLLVNLCWLADGGIGFNWNELEFNYELCHTKQINFMSEEKTSQGVKSGTTDGHKMPLSARWADGRTVRRCSRKLWTLPPPFSFPPFLGHHQIKLKTANDATMTMTDVRDGSTVLHSYLVRTLPPTPTFHIHHP